MRRRDFSRERERWCFYKLLTAPFDLFVLYVLRSSEYVFLRLKEGRRRRRVVVVSHALLVGGFTPTFAWYYLRRIEEDKSPRLERQSGIVGAVEDPMAIAMF